MLKTIIPALLSVTLAAPLASYADCHEEADAFYQRFKAYRQHINTASHIADLTPYFSNTFIQYFEVKLLAADSDDEKRRYLTQFWDNLNTAKDIVIIFDYSVQCFNKKTNLDLIAVLDTNQGKDHQTIKLWKVGVSYVLEQDTWKINAFEYQEYNKPEKYIATDIKDNFTRIR